MLAEPFGVIFRDVILDVAVLWPSLRSSLDIHIGHGFSPVPSSPAVTIPRHCDSSRRSEEPVTERRRRFFGGTSEYLPLVGQSHPRGAVLRLQSPDRQSRQASACPRNSSGWLTSNPVMPERLCKHGTPTDLFIVPSSAIFKMPEQVLWLRKSLQSELWRELSIKLRELPDTAQPADRRKPNAKCRRHACADMSVAAITSAAGLRAADRRPVEAARSIRAAEARRRPAARRRPVDQPPQRRSVHRR